MCLVIWFCLTFFAADSLVLLWSEVDQPKRVNLSLGNYTQPVVIHREVSSPLAFSWPLKAFSCSRAQCYGLCLTSCDSMKSSWKKWVRARIVNLVGTLNGKVTLHIYFFRTGATAGNASSKQFKGKYPPTVRLVKKTNQYLFLHKLDRGVCFLTGLALTSPLSTYNYAPFIKNSKADDNMQHYASSNPFRLHLQMPRGHIYMWHKYPV